MIEADVRFHSKRNRTYLGTLIPHHPLGSTVDITLSYSANLYPRYLNQQLQQAVLDAFASAGALVTILPSF